MQGRTHARGHYRNFCKKGIIEGGLSMKKLSCKGGMRVV